MSRYAVKLPPKALRLLPWLALATAALLAMTAVPALFRSENAVQIRASRHGLSLPDGFYLYQTLNAQGIRIKSITPDKDALVIKFESEEQSHAAEKVLRQMLPYEFDIARQEEHGVASWVNRISARSQSLG